MRAEPPEGEGHELPAVVEQRVAPDPTDVGVVEVGQWRLRRPGQEAMVHAGHVTGRVVQGEHQGPLDPEVVRSQGHGSGPDEWLLTADQRNVDVRKLPDALRRASPAAGCAGLYAAPVPEEVTGDKVGLALDCGPGWTVPDAIRFAKAVEPLNVMWCEDMLTGDYITHVSPDVYREVTESTSTPIHTGEQIYDRQNFRQLIESHAVRIIGPDPADVGGIAELKWIAEFADMHGILIAPHGVANGLLGLAAQVQMCATLPQNYIAFEYPIGQPDWWYDIVEGLPDPIAKDGFVDVWDAPGLGVTLNPAATRPHLRDEDKDFFE